MRLYLDIRDDQNRSMLIASASRQIFFGVKCSSRPRFKLKMKMLKHLVRRSPEIESSLRLYSTLKLPSIGPFSIRSSTSSRLGYGTFELSRGESTLRAYWKFAILFPFFLCLRSIVFFPFFLSSFFRDIIYDHFND